MGLTRIFDRVFLDQLFQTNALGETVFYPNGAAGRGFLLPAEREPVVRSGVRRLLLLALLGSLALVVLVPRAIEGALGFTLPLGWFVGGVAVVLVVMVTVIIRALARLTHGLAPVS